MTGLPWINGVNSTSLKVVTGCVLAVMLTAFYCFVQSIQTLIKDEPIDPVILGEVLAFAAAFAGIAYKQFAKKRETEIVTPPQTTAEHAAPVATTALLPNPPVPQAGVQPANPQVRQALESLAAKQPPAIDGEGD
jgi:hypothetical protein